jgi:hypothetical protein
MILTASDRCVGDCSLPEGVGRDHSLIDDVSEQQALFWGAGPSLKSKKINKSTDSILTTCYLIYLRSFLAIRKIAAAALRLHYAAQLQLRECTLCFSIVRMHALLSHSLRLQATRTRASFRMCVDLWFRAACVSSRGDLFKRGIHAVATYFLLLRAVGELMGSLQIATRMQTRCLEIAADTSPSRARCPAA